LDHAVAVNPGGVNGPVRISVLEKDDAGTETARILNDDELDEHRENIGEAKERLRDLRDAQGPGRIDDAPDVPSP
jgi:hypothetical protein